MAGNLVKSVMLKIVAEDGDAQVKLDRIGQKADELGAKHPELKVRIDTAAASAKLAVLRGELKAAQQEADKTSVLGRLGDLAAARGAQAGKGLGIAGGLAAGAGGLLGLAAPLAAGTAAVGAFGAVAVPIFQKILAAHQQLTAAQQAYNKATTAAGRASALRAEQQATAGLTGAQKNLMGQVVGLQGAWGRLQNQMTPMVVTVASLGTKLATALMPAVEKLAPAGARILTAFVRPLTALVSSPFFGRFAAEMARVAAVAGGVLGPQLVALVRVFAQLLMQIMPPGVQILGVLLPLIVRLVSDLVPVIAVGARVVAVTLSWLQHTHLLIPLLGVLAAVVLTLNAPIAAVVAAVVVLIAVGVDLYRHWGRIWSGIKRLVADAVGFIKGHWQLILGILTGPVGLAVAFIVSHWHQITAGAGRMVGDVTGFFRSLPGRILSAVGNLGRLLWQGGVNLVMGLVHGIESVASAPFHAVSSIVSSVRNLLPFSPAKAGPLAGSGSPELAGRKIPLMLASGIDAGRGVVAAAAARMAGAVAMPTAAGGGGAGGGAARVELVLSGDGEFMTALARLIREKGGSPEILHRKVVFAS